MPHNTRQILQQLQLINYGYFDFFAFPFSFGNNGFGTLDATKALTKIKGIYVGGKHSMKSAVTITGLRFVYANEAAIHTAAAKFPLIPTTKAKANAKNEAPVTRGNIAPPRHPKLIHK